MNLVRIKLTIFIICSIIPMAIASDFAGGSGTEDDPYLIENSAHLNAVPDSSDSHFRQESDIEFDPADFQSGGEFYNDGKGWEPIEDFLGTYDGNGYSISNIRIARHDENRVGLFANVYEGTLKNITIVNGEISGDESVGGLAGEINSSLVENCSFSGSVTGDDEDIGGLVGYSSNSQVIHSYTTGAVFSTGEVVGGLIGGVNNNSEVEYSGSSVQVNSDGDRIGGLIGSNSGEVFRSYSTGDVMGDGRRVGGFVGNNSGTIRQSSATGGVSGDGERIGGFVGNHTGTIEESYSTGEVSGDERVGGFVGRSSGDISSSYSRATVLGRYSVGGFAGYSASSNIQNSYSTGPVSVSSRDSGGFVGQEFTSTVEGSFWDMETSGQDSSAAGTGKTTEELTNTETFTDAGWDFDSIWGRDEKMNDGYPYLLWQRIPPSIISWPTVDTAYYGATMDDLTLSGGEADVDGEFLFYDTTDERLPLGESEHTLLFLPHDEETYLSVDTLISVQVDPAPVTVSAERLSKVYGDDDPPLTYTVEGLLDDDELTGELTRESGEDVGTYVINQGSLSVEEYYSLSFSAGIFEITPRPVNVQADTLSKIYGEDDPDLSYTADGLLGEDTLTGHLERESGEDVGEYSVLQGSLSSGENYSMTFGEGFFRIHPRELIIRADDSTIEEGGDEPEEYPVSYEGFAFDDDESVVTGLIVVRVPGDTVGTYAIVPSGAEADNYTITFENGVFTITESTDIIYEDEVAHGGASRGVYFGETPVSLWDETVDIFVVTGDAAQVSITIYDMVGNVIDRQEAPAQTREAGRFTWDLRNRRGMRVSAGSYAVIATVEYDNGTVERYRGVLGVRE
ncbi:MBG domain-containing protein [Chitinivibrio alkaliphilus]|uniref:GLUG domain-containing protein n=1 Tax=Chitinivibrio alkaliphilus ACht1 TaxID=1313304 RepID=U7DEE6_9BACT|nr:MBG domain-containing protein [Chitinivibrio alkaliphilus]ERP39286.1 hypothetical protein CALK_0078 [Chitinivibrio alkaliphilus ACht1]